MKKILILEPYYGGSHKLFLDGLRDHLNADFHQLVLPARKWKMRMQLSAPWFVEELKKLPESGRWFDSVLASTFVDLAMFRALVQNLSGWNPETRFCCYFHENQFGYPNRVMTGDLFQFGAINFNSALAADAVAFNSLFNRQSFLSSVAPILKKGADMDLTSLADELDQKSRVIHPGIDFESFPARPSTEATAIPVIVWNHRWEHDKNPELFFQTLNELQDEDVPFQLIVLGQSFNNRPACFQRAQKRLAERIVHFGYAPSRAEYLRLLARGDIVVSTADHEFFGIAIIEAVRAGCRPLLPADLAYPELFDKSCLYERGCLKEELMSRLQHPNSLTAEQSVAMTDRFSWDHLIKDYEEFLFGD
ncbi:MAG: DUF3524 domain-containing protein [Thermodesulfobacteriota bacterium]